MGHTTPTIARRFAVTGCGVLASIGIGVEAFTAGLEAGRSGQTSVAGLFEEPMPSDKACYISDFETRKFLGKKGTSFLNRFTALTITACGMAIEHSGLKVTDDNRDQIGVVLGSAMGSAQSISNFTRETLIHDRPYLVNPVLFANATMNCAAGQSAIWHSLRAINTTVSGGQLSSLSALRYTLIAMRQGYANAILVGGAEELSPHMAWGFHHAGVLADTHTLVGEGCAIFVLEDLETTLAAGRTPLVEILACEIGMSSGEPAHNPRDTADRLAACIQRALQRAGVTPDQVWALCGGFTGNKVLDRVEEEGICLALGRMPTLQLRIKQLIGECYSAAGALQLAALLSLYKTNLGSATERIALVTSVGHDGSTGCALVKEIHP